MAKDEVWNTLKRGLKQKRRTPFRVVAAKLKLVLRVVLKTTIYRGTSKLPPATAVL